MRFNTKACQLVALGFLVMGSLALASAQDSSTQPAADNTKVNQRDANSPEPTADQQKDNRSDRDIAQQIRQAVIKDKSLSTYAHNVKIICQNGTVTLKGPVRSDEEKQTIEKMASDIVGSDKVTSELAVKPKK